jgi:hypothetical protein
MTMASDPKKAKAAPAPAKAAKADPAPKADSAPKTETAAKDTNTSGEAVAKTDSGETAAAAPSSYSRGEGQKPVTKAYKENWNLIFGKKKTKSKR